MKQRLKSLVGWNRRAQSLRRGPGQTRSRLLTEVAKQSGCTVEILAGDGAGEGQETHHESDNDRIDSRVFQEEPRCNADKEIDESASNAQPYQDDNQSNEKNRDE